MNRVVLDFSAGHRPEPGEILVLWDRFDDGAAGTTAYSLPQLVRDAPDYWIDRFSSWLSNLSFGDGDATGLAPRLIDRAGLSYWWMTLPTEFAFAQGSIAYRVLRLWAFAELADQLGVQSVELVDAPAMIVEVIGKWASGTGRTVLVTGASTTAQSARSGLLAGMRFLLAQYRDYGRGEYRGQASASRTDRGFTVVDYLANFSVDRAATHPYVSGYWGELVDLLEETASSIRWIHIHYPSVAAPTARVAQLKMDELNAHSPHHQHELIQCWNSATVTARAMGRLARLWLRGRVLRQRVQWRDRASGMELWPLLCDDWDEWFSGVPAAQNLLWPLLFDRALRSDSHRDACIYLMENQGWELALNSAWRTHGSGPTIGVVHSVARKWDFRYAVRRLADHPEAHLPQPDLVVAASPRDLQVLSSDGFTSASLREGEAVRFSDPGHLLTSPKGAVATPGRRKILVLGEYDSQMTDQLINVMNELVSSRPGLVNITYRPHPASSHRLELLDKTVVVDDRDLLILALQRHDSVICSSVSSAAVQASLCGVKPILLLDGRVLDGVALPPGTFHAAATLDDVLALVAIPPEPGGIPQGQSEYFFGSEFARWKLLLAPLTA